MTGRPRCRTGPALGACREQGQSTVEFALVLPLIVLMLLAIVQTALVARDEVLVVHAAREAAREASVDAGDARVRAAVERVLPGASVLVAPNPGVGEPRAVTVRFVSHTDLPVVGAIYPDPEIAASVTMRAER